MPTHLWTIFCTRASTDSATNNISLFEIIEQIGLPRADIEKIPEAKDQPIAINVSGDLVTVFVRDDFETPEDDREGRIIIESPDKTPLGGGEFRIDLNSAPRTRNTSRIPALAI